jgi:plasmid stability protein
MAQLVVRNLEDIVKEKLRQRAALHGHSLEEEVRQILRVSVREIPRRREPPPEIPAEFGLGTRIANLFRGRGLDFEIPEFDEPIEPATFDE